MLKLPKKLRNEGVIQVNQVAVFTSSIISAAKVACKVYEKDDLPGYGYVLHKGERFYWCSISLLGNDDIYETD